jgi:hypothetical protein
MTPPLEPPDSLHLQAAEGWVGLGDYNSATEELERISAANRDDPHVLQLRWRILVVVSPTSRIRLLAQIFLPRKRLIFRAGSSEKEPKVAVVQTHPIPKLQTVCIIQYQDVFAL